MGLILTKLFLLLAIGVVFLIIITFNVLAHFVTLDLLDYLKKHFPAKYCDVSMEKSHGLFALFFPAGNPINMPIFLLSSENLGDNRVKDHKRKIRKYYLMAFIILIGFIITLMVI